MDVEKQLLSMPWDLYKGEISAQILMDEDLDIS